MKDILKQIPSVDRMLNTPEAADVLSKHPRPLVTRAARNVQERLRSAVKSGDLKTIPPAGEIQARVRAEVERLVLGRFCPVVNATGIILHTNLGRAPLAQAAMEAIQRTAGGYLALEMDLDTGERGSRQKGIEDLLRETTGAEAGMVVNNNAAAVLLALDALAGGKEAVVSRSELVEIGGSFRMPDVMAKGGVKLVEVGTTNKSRIGDYRDAITPATGLILKVHQSNFRMVGFTEAVRLEELVALGREFGIPVLHDAGSGALSPLRKLGFHEEPLIEDSVRAGADVTTFSGDKLLGGPQAGIIVGSRDCVERLKRNPLTRALRPGKLTLAALEATLRLYADDGLALSQVPVLKMMAEGPKEMAKRARTLAKLIAGAVGDRMAVAAEEGRSAIGGGSLPGEELPTQVVAVSATWASPQEIIARLRGNAPPVIARIQEDRVVLDVRTISEEQTETVAEALRRLCEISR